MAKIKGRRKELLLSMQRGKLILKAYLIKTERNYMCVCVCFLCILIKHASMCEDEWGILPFLYFFLLSQALYGTAPKFQTEEGWIWLPPRFVSSDILIGQRGFVVTSKIFHQVETISLLSDYQERMETQNTDDGK